jgi:arylsulfatase A-like enzyme
VLPFSSYERENGKPNIIFLLTDDQRDNSFGIMGHSWVKTPNVDRLIKNGVRFSNTYIAEPTCSPSRVSIFTGMHERIHGVGFSSSYKLTEEQWEQTYPALLRKNGYYTGFIGKFGVEYYSFKAPEKFDYWWGHDGWTKFFPKDFDTPSTQPYHKAKENIITNIEGEAIEGFLNTCPRGKPFCLSVSFSTPHGSQAISMYPESKDAITMMMPANENPKLKGHPIFDTLYRNIEIKIPDETATDPYRFIPKYILDQGKGRANQTYLYNYNLVSNKEHHIRYYQLITGLDKIIGEMFVSLEKRGLANNTVIIFASDNGLLMGEYGMGGKELLYDLTSKIPCFVYDPGLEKSLQGRTIENFVSSLDLTSTILDYAGVNLSVNMEGESLKPLIYGKEVKWRSDIFLESLFTMRDNPFCEGIREGKWKYIRMYNGIMGYKEQDVEFSGRKPDFEQLFNLHDDPGEKQNLISQYEGKDMLKRLRSNCQAYSDSINKKRRIYMEQHLCEPKRVNTIKRS